DLIPLAIYGALSPDRQARIFNRFNGRRKVVVATNIAETTITIDGIVYVVDSGLIKQMELDPISGIQQLDTRPHSQAGCEQRKGRAGRTQEGICYRMYTEESFFDRPQFTTPEILRTSLAGVILTMIDIGIKEIEDFDFIDSPDRESFREAYQTLLMLGAISSDRKRLTELGRSMAKLPLEPRIARMLLEAQKHSCIKEVATIAAFLSVRNVFFLPRKEEERYMARQMHARFKSRESDALTFLKVWEEYKASGSDQNWCVANYLNSKSLQEVAKIREQLFEILTQVGMEISESDDSDAIAKAVVAGLISNLLEHRSRFSYDAVLREACGNVFIHPGSSLFGVTPRLLVAAEIIETKKVYASNCTAVKPEWLPELLPHLCSLGDVELQSYTPGENHVAGRRQIIFNGVSYGYREVKVAIDEAKKIQDKRIAERSEERR
ncbi:MAG: oligonucleotide/oligosaccharide-binding fold domain-containing protein, partial [Candidatus Paceibacterota bacterium]